MLYHVSWPKSGTVENLAQNFMTSLRSSKEAYVIFDHYNEDSIKSHERERRAAAIIPQYHTLTQNTVLPPMDVVMKNVHNKKQLIEQLCLAPHDEHIHIIGEQECIYGHEEADVNIITYMLSLLKERRPSRLSVVIPTSSCCCCTSSGTISQLPTLL